MWDGSHGCSPHATRDHVTQRGNRQQQTFCSLTATSSSAGLRRGWVGCFWRQEATVRERSRIIEHSVPGFGFYWNSGITGITGTPCLILGIPGTPYLILHERDCHGYGAAQGTDFASGHRRLPLPHNCERQSAAADLLQPDGDEFIAPLERERGRVRQRKRTLRINSHDGQGDERGSSRPVVEGLPHNSNSIGQKSFRREVKLSYELFQALPG